MFSLRGDVHKFYLKLKKVFNRQHSVEDLKELDEMADIQAFYRGLPAAQLKQIRYRMLKEQNGNGMIPLLVSSMPWLAFIFSQELRNWLNKNILLLLGFLIAYTFFIAFGSVLHYREKAWASVHIEILNDLLEEKQNDP
ncbi:MAG TPA: hypothetical protein VFK33_05230 [Bacillales bacterium]|nr:hypothetical protein [Bacillales bacterium]